MFVVGLPLDLCLDLDSIPILRARRTQRLRTKANSQTTTSPMNISIDEVTTKSSTVRRKSNPVMSRFQKEELELFPRLNHALISDSKARKSTGIAMVSAASTVEVSN